MGKLLSCLHCDSKKKSYVLVFSQSLLHELAGVSRATAAVSSLPRATSSAFGLT
jgi:hypothetical protein